MEQTGGNIIRGQHYRISVLTDSLIRMEYSEIGEFADQATQVVMNREFPATRFQVEETETELRIVTEALRLKYDKRKFSAEGLSIVLRGQYAHYSSKWSYGDEPRDLGGTARTLDEADGRIPLEHGILSAYGWSILDDSHSLLLNEDGSVRVRKDSDAVDFYFFGYGREYLACLADYYHLTGQTPLLPRFALGNWWSRYYPYSEKTYLSLMDRFEKEEIPFTVAVIDMDWHLTRIDPKYGAGWTGYTWNRDLFPQPERFLQNLHDRGLKVTLNVHPADGVRAFEDAYPSFAEYMGVDREKEEPVEFAPGDPRFMDGYFEFVHHPLERQGVDFWWIDWQQGTNSGVKGLDPLWILNHRHYTDSQKNHDRGLIFSRYGGPGSHRYPVGFSGDTIVSWESLDFQPYFTATASNIGYGWWSHDIGGHMWGVKDDELAVRWVQLGVFSPILRLHSSNNIFNGKEPWRYNLIAEKVMKEFLRLRHRMIPYLYAMNLRASRDNLPLVQPLYYQNPYEPQAFRVKNEYYFGSELLVCPITSPADKETGRAVFNAWLPEGLWTDYFTGMVYEGNRMMELYRGISEIPALMKAGAILVLDGREDGNRTDNPASLEICVNAVGDGAFTLWEDDGREAVYREELWAETRMKVEVGQSAVSGRDVEFGRRAEPGQSAVSGQDAGSGRRAESGPEAVPGQETAPGQDAVFTIEPAEGRLEVLPEERSYRLKFYGVSQEAEPSVWVDGTEFGEFRYVYDEGRGILTVSLPAICVRKRIAVWLKNAKIHDNQRLSRVYEYIDQAQIRFGSKEDIYRIAEKIEKNVPPVYVTGQLLQLNERKEIIGPVLEILLARAR